VKPLPPEVSGYLWTLAITTVAAVFAYLAGRRRATEDRKHRAKEIASALLMELRFSEGMLREMYAEEQPMRFLWYVPLPLFDRLFPELRVLSPDAMRLAYTFYGIILEIRARFQFAQGHEARPADHHFVRVKAGFALERMRPLVAALKKEGGVLPPLEPLLAVRDMRLPPLPPPLFPEMLNEIDVGQ
jgi:hypothetical protein